MKNVLKLLVVVSIFLSSMAFPVLSFAVLQEDQVMLSNHIPVEFIIKFKDEAIVGAVAGTGIWQWDSTNWTQVTPNNPQQMVASESNLYGVFTGGGIWKWDGTIWTQLTPNEPASMVTGY